MSNRIEGQIWISEASPYNLYYHVNDHDYALSNKILYNDLDESSLDKLFIGAIVATDYIDKEGSKVPTLRPAVFPDDMDSAVGMVVSIDSSNVEVNNNSYVTLAGDDLAKCFLEEDLSVGTNGWMKASEETGENINTIGFGAPVYWFIGKTESNANNNNETPYTYKPSENFPGHITLSTPSGYKWKRTTVDDNSMNVGYDNLPIVGNVSKYTVKDGKITSMDIHVNFSKFDTSLEWTWPYLHYITGDEGDCGKLSKTINGNIQEDGHYQIRHGLFADSENYKLRNFIETTCLTIPDGDEFPTLVDSGNIYTGDDRYTEINYSSPEDLYYRISGRVNYRFDKNHPVRIVR